MQNLLQDFRYALRALARSPGLTFVAALSLALGIGANTAIYSVIDAVLLRALPFSEHERLLVAWKSGGAGSQSANGEISELSIPEFNDWRAQSQSFSSLAAMPTTVYGYGFILTKDGEPAVQLESAKVTAGFFSTLGASAALGRTFTEAEDRPGADRVVVLSDRLWRNRFHADPALIGQSIRLNGTNTTVIGVMPREFTFPSGADLWAPLRTNQQQNENRGAVFLQVIGRLKPGVDVEQARAELNGIIERVNEAHPEASSGEYRVALTSLSDYIFGNTQMALWLLLAASAFLLLIACANVANLLLSRATKRAREVAVRSALGATRLRLVRQFLTESFALALCGGTLGLLISYWLVDLLISLAPADIPRIENVRINTTVLLFTAALTLLTAFVFGLVPALAASRIDLNEALKEGSGKLAGERRGGRLRGALIVAEVSLTLTLLVGAGLLLRSFQNLRSVDLGYIPDRVLTAQLRLRGAQYDDRLRAQNFYQQLLERLEARPEVAAAGGILIRPLEGSIGWEMDYATENQSPDEVKRNVMANYEVVTPHYFRAMNITLHAGRDFNEQDKMDSAPVAIISQSLARRLFAAGVDPVGQRIKLDPADADSPWRMIVGVAGDARYRQLQNIRFDIYVPYRQSRILPSYLTVRTNTEAHNVIPILRGEIAALDPEQAMTGVLTMDELIARSLAGPRFIALLLGLLALMTAILAAIGLYSVISFMVAERTHEIGVRVALGAQNKDVLRLVVGHGMLLTAIGIVLGGLCALVGTRVLAGLLYGVTPTDPLTLLTISGGLLLIALLACYLPARRATKVDPLVALRYE